MATLKAPIEWKEQYVENCGKADDSLRAAEKIRDEATWLVKERENETDRAQQDVKFRLQEKVRSTSRWQQELKEELQLNKKQTESLSNGLTKLKKALIKTDEPMKVNSECQNYRKSRIGIDKIEDGVEELLIKEVNAIREYQQRMKLLIEEMLKQVEANTKAQKNLMTDMKHKKAAVNIDTICNKLNNHSGDLENHSRIQNILVNKSVPQSWNRDSQLNVQLSRNCRFSSQQLERDSSNLTRRAENAMKTNWADTNNALRERISQTQLAHSKLADQRKQVEKEIVSTRRELKTLKAAHHDKLAPVKLAQTRLEQRSHRPDNEACTDSVHARLLRESLQLEQSKQLLNKKIKESEEALNRLEEDKIMLDRDIKVKKITLNIDKTKCLPLRAIFKFDMEAKVVKKKLPYDF